MSCQCLRSKTIDSYSETTLRVTGHFDRCLMISAPLNFKTNLPLCLEQLFVEHDQGSDLFAVSGFSIAYVLDRECSGIKITLTSSS